MINLFLIIGAAVGWLLAVGVFWGLFAFAAVALACLLVVIVLQAISMARDGVTK